MAYCPAKAIVESQHDLFVAQEVELFEMLETETRPACRVDSDHPCDTERVWIGAGCL